LEEKQIRALSTIWKEGENDCRFSAPEGDSANSRGKVLGTFMSARTGLKQAKGGGEGPRGGVNKELGETNRPCWVEG